MSQSCCSPQFGLNSSFIDGKATAPMRNNNQCRLTPGWVQVGGVLSSLFGAYYLGAAWDDIEGRCPLRFYQFTIFGRLLLTAAFMWLVAAKQMPPLLLLLAAINVWSAWSMHQTM